MTELITLYAASGTSPTADTTHNVPALDRITDRSPEQATADYTLNEDERKRLTDLEAIMRIADEPNLARGAALWEIHEARLYREEFKSFETYTHYKWNLTARRAYQLIAAAKVRTTVRTGVPEAAPEAIGERQARALAGLDDEQVIKTYRAALRAHPGKTVTGPMLKKKRQQMFPSAADARRAKKIEKARIEQLRTRALSAAPEHTPASERIVRYVAAISRVVAGLDVAHTALADVDRERLQDAANDIEGILDLLRRLLCSSHLPAQPIGDDTHAD